MYIGIGSMLLVMHNLRHLLAAIWFDLLFVHGKGMYSLQFVRSFFKQAIQGSTCILIKNPYCETLYLYIEFIFHKAICASSILPRSTCLICSFHCLLTFKSFSELLNLLWSVSWIYSYLMSTVLYPPKIYLNDVFKLIYAACFLYILTLRSVSK